MTHTAAALARAHRLFESGDHPAAEEICCKLLVIAPKTTAALRRQTVIALGRDEARTAVEFIRRAIEIEPGAGEHHDLLGTTYRQLGEFEQAAACYQHAIRLDPNLAASHNNLGACLLDQGQVAEAVTAVAHLAGALGVPTWLALDHHADWRWMRERDDSPWYPTIRLFRQTTAGDWDSIFATLCDALHEEVRPA